MLGQLRNSGPSLYEDRVTDELGKGQILTRGTLELEDGVLGFRSLHWNAPLGGSRGVWQSSTLPGYKLPTAPRGAGLRAPSPHQ